ncbi:MAG: hypothetical protein L0H84_24020, partial [Pseudonocardia sp.]|nr:hypothetical protein [Pseudonocardia sp.]
MGSLLRGGSGRPLRRAVLGSGAAAAVVASVVLLPSSGETTLWRDRAMDLAADLARSGQAQGSPAVALATELRQLGYAPVPQLPAGQAQLPAQDPEPDNSDDDDGDSDS